MKNADICLLLEGTYPYTSGGVSTWTHQLLEAQSDLTFHLICLVPAYASLKLRYPIPENVVGMDTIHLQKFAPAKKRLSRQEREAFFEELEMPLLSLQKRPSLKVLETISKIFNNRKGALDEEVLLNSEEAWRMTVRLYNTLLGDSSFVNFFWSMRNLLGSFYSIMLIDLPPAALYHTFCTGFAGLLLARAKVETAKPCLTTEHGIYTNERRIEIASAVWLDDEKSMNLEVDLERFAFDLKDFWINSFDGYSYLCYQASDSIVTLYEGNKELQQADGAAIEKLSIIPNGIDYDLFSAIKREKEGPPTVALIGRVVPIKDIKTFIRAVDHLKKRVPDIQALIMGPEDEDEEYSLECRELVKALNLEETLIFTGKVSIVDYLPRIHVLVLSSISEAQPFVILEAGAAGIPSVSTDVGACREMIYGRDDEYPPLGQGGVVCPLANPQALAEGMELLLNDPKFYSSCSRTIQERVSLYYRKEREHSAYQTLYQSYLETSGVK